MARVKNMTQGNPFAIPLMLGNICQQLYTVADTAIVGKFVGVEALAAVGAAGWPVWFIPGILQGLSQGMAVLPTQQFGAGDLRGMNRSNAMTLLICLASGVVLMGVGMLVSEPLMLLINTTPDLMPDALAYLRIMLCGTLPVTVYNVFACFLQAMGNGRTPLVSMFTASVVNIVLDLVFILVFDWGVPGAAWATVIAQYPVRLCLHKASCVRLFCRGLEAGLEADCETSAHRRAARFFEADHRNRRDDCTVCGKRLRYDSGSGLHSGDTFAGPVGDSGHIVRFCDGDVYRPESGSKEVRQNPSGDKGWKPHGRIDRCIDCGDYVYFRQASAVAVCLGRSGNTGSGAPNCL